MICYLYHQFIDVPAVFLIQCDEAADGAAAAIAVTKGVDQIGNILFLRTQLLKILRHANGDQEVSQRFYPRFGSHFRMEIIHLATPDTDGDLRKTHYIVLTDICKYSRHCYSKPCAMMSVMPQAV